MARVALLALVLLVAVAAGCLATAGAQNGGAPPAAVSAGCAPESENCAGERCGRASARGCGEGGDRRPDRDGDAREGDGRSEAPRTDGGTPPADGGVEDSADETREVAVATPGSAAGVTGDGEGGELPFTGLAIGALALAGLGLGAAGLAIRRRTAAGETTGEAS